MASFKQRVFKLHDAHDETPLDALRPLKKAAMKTALKVVSIVSIITLALKSIPMLAPLFLLEFGFLVKAELYMV